MKNQIQLQHSTICLRSSPHVPSTISTTAAVMTRTASLYDVQHIQKKEANALLWLERRRRNLCMVVLYALKSETGSHVALLPRAPFSRHIRQVGSERSPLLVS